MSHHIITGTQGEYIIIGFIVLLIVMLVVKALGGSS